MLCEKCKKIGIIQSCTVDENGDHHSYNDQPAKIWQDGQKDWFKHGKKHRENGKPAVIERSGFRQYYYNGHPEVIMYASVDEKNNTVIHENDFYIILKKISHNFYFCLINNEKRYVFCLEELNINTIIETDNFFR